MDLSPLNPEASFEFAEKYAEKIVNNIEEGAFGYTTLHAHLRYCENLETLCTTHPGDGKLIEQYATLLNYTAETAFSEEEYGVVADCVKKVRTLYAAYPDLPGMTIHFLYSMLWDAKRVFPLWSGEDSGRICLDCGVQPPEKDLDETENKKHWVARPYEIWALEKYLYILAGNAKLAVELHPDDEVVSRLYASLLAEIVFDYYWEQDAGGEELTTYDSEPIYEELTRFAKEKNNADVLCSLMEASVYYIRQIDPKDFTERDALRAKLQEMLSPYPESEHTELHGGYARVCAAAIQDCTGEENREACMKIHKDITGLYARYPDEKTVRLAYGELYGGYVLHSGNFTKEECDALYPEIREKVLTDFHLPDEKEAQLLAFSKIEEFYNEKGWELPEEYDTMYVPIEGDGEEEK